VKPKGTWWDFPAEWNGWKMIKTFWRWVVIGGLLFTGCGKTSNTISGIVQDEFRPVSGAIVRVQTSDIFTTTDENGQFEIAGLPADNPVRLTAWASGYYIVASEDEVSPGENGVLLELTAHSDTDHPGYQWVSGFSDAGEDGNCQNCHASPDGNESGLPFDEWLVDAHSGSATNRRFITMYTGRDVDGNQSPLTRKGFSRDYGAFPLVPDKSLPYYGPGYQLDFPDTTGNCAACHAPAAAVNAPYSTDPTRVSGVGAEGVSCDFCHKVWAVRLDPSGLPYPNMPGVLSFEFRRPAEGHQFFAGPYDDVAPGEDTYSPLQQQSEFCAPCHFGTFWDTTVYNSFGEWLESPYSDPETGQTCQDCHMPAGLTDHFAMLEKGGNIRDPETIFSHLMLGITNEQFMQNSISVKVDATRENNQVTVRVELINDNTGHHIPTDSPLRNMILLVSAVDANGKPLDQVQGPTVPDWGGEGDPAFGYFAGLSGTGYAKILQELWTEVSPTGAYWNQTRVISDNRIPAMESDISNYLFEGDALGDVMIEVRLIFRRAFIGLMDQKGWEIPDLEIFNQTLILQAND
jgi:mono/diheme cytochrome c family protein